MAVYSMTGYASASSQPSATPDNSGVSAPQSKAGVSVELRSVNGRFLDLGFRMPEDLRGLEPALRELLTAKFKRGKIELRINTQSGGDSGWPQPQPDQLMRLARLESTISGWLPNARPLSVNEALAAPGQRLVDAMNDLSGTKMKFKDASDEDDEKEIVTQDDDETSKAPTKPIPGVQIN